MGDVIRFPGKTDRCPHCRASVVWTKANGREGWWCQFCVKWVKPKGR